MFQCVPQCDFDGLAPKRVCVEGDDYHYYSAYQYYLEDGEAYGPHAPFVWSQMPAHGSKPYYDLEAHDRERAYKERNKMIRAIVASPWHEAFTFVLEPTIVFGAVWDIGVYYAYSNEDDVIWVYGHPNGVVDVVLHGGDCLWADDDEADDLELAQRLYHLLLMRELNYACGPITR